MTKELVHSILLIICIALAFIFPQTALVAYDIEIAATLFALLFVARKFAIFSKRTRLFESIVFTLVIVGLVNTTGGMNSPFFFLIYFLLFALTLLLEPIISIVATLSLMIFFVLGMQNHATLQELLPLFSLALMTPFALILGNEYEETQRLKKTMSTQTENTDLFLSLMLKNSLHHIQDQIDQFTGDRELQTIQKAVHTMQKQIDMFEKEQ